MFLFHLSNSTRVVSNREDESSAMESAFFFFSFRCLNKQSERVLQWVWCFFFCLVSSLTVVACLFNFSSSFRIFSPLRSRISAHLLVFVSNTTKNSARLFLERIYFFTEWRRRRQLSIGARWRVMKGPCLDEKSRATRSLRRPSNGFQSLSPLLDAKVAHQR